MINKQDKVETFEEIALADPSTLVAKDAARKTAKFVSSWSFDQPLYASDQVYN